MSGKWITPFTKQCFVTLGACISTAQVGLVVGIVTSLGPQLQDKSSSIIVDDDLISWIASIPCITMLIGNTVVSYLMAKLGRKKANIIGITIMLIGWLCLYIANSVTVLFVGRCIQGVAIGIAVCLTPTIIGECSSPKNRGPFSVCAAVLMAFGTFTVHTLGCFLYWRTTVLSCTFITATNLLMVCYSPETPAWLASKGRYNECQKSFRWLRGDSEEEELSKMIEANKIYESTKDNRCKDTFKKRVKTMLNTFKKREFYKPIIIMIHLYTMGQFGGTNVLSPYMITVICVTVGTDINTSAMIISVGLNRIIFCIVSVFVIRMLKRRTMMITTIGLNGVIWLVLAGFTYARQQNMLPFDHPAIGGLLLHLLMFTIAIGSSPLPFTIAGEIYPIRHKSLASSLSVLFRSLNTFIVIQSFPFLVKTTGFSGAFCIFAAIIFYCLAVVWFMLPETKDKTLQDIEDELIGKIEGDEQSKEPLKSKNGAENEDVK